MRNVPICSSRACCSAPGGSLRAVSKSLAAIFSRSCILSPLHFAVQNTTGFGEALSVRYRTPPLICRTAGKLCKCYAALGLNHRLTGPAHPRHDLLAVVFVAGHDLPPVTVSEREPSLTHPQRRLSRWAAGHAPGPQPPGNPSSRGFGCSGGNPLATWRTIAMISCTISPRAPPVASLSRYSTAARISVLASSGLANSQSS
jgi:hypothetical protein